ncbi:HD domain-containing protein [Candidatus Protochlamydia phocaeensis]|uniref:HD domain-containing protein n=1 Tax=Candidatus Protochlamydia phocaeensis TaxID=1414722 RepID=UPI0008384A10|nr:HD domain-containing protein [Candidatus Protochlamydia phocaeensis]
MSSSLQELVNLLNEIGMLAHVPRSGFAFLGSGEQSVAEHSFRVALIAYALAHLSSEPVDRYKLIMLCLVHDLPESRIGDLNYVQKKYVTAHLNKALEDLSKGSDLGPEIVSWIEDYEQEESLEARLAHDADQIELLLVLKREQELGNARAHDWFQNGLKRIKTKEGKQLAEAIQETASDHWWMGDREDPHWIDGGKGKKPSS